MNVYCRFSLLLLDPGEIYFEDFSANLISFDNNADAGASKKQSGRLKLCSKSLVFEPKHITLPLIKIPLRECKIIEQWKSRSRIFKDNNVINVMCKQYVLMLEGNLIAPYTFCSSGNYLFELNYAKVEDCLPQICQLHRASSLPAAEQTDMVCNINIIMIRLNRFPMFINNIGHFWYESYFNLTFTDLLIKIIKFII